MERNDKAAIEALLKRHGFHFSKSMGQNFLIDPDIPYNIAEASGADAHCGVLEIGPGIGPLTQQLAQRAGRVVAIELDTALLPILQETMAEYDNVTIRHGDILKQNLPELVAEVFDGLTPMVCANLPYNITTPVLTALLESQQFSAITVMIQREVAKRICAQPGTSDYGAFSLYCQYHAQCELLFEVPPDCFIPAPKVTSAVITLRTRQKRPWDIADEAVFFRAVRASFAMRRKKLSNGLSSGFPELGKAGAEAVIAAAGFDANVRGETLGIPEFARIANEIVRQKEKMRP